MTLEVLQTVRLKGGMADAATIAAVIGTPAAEVEQLVAALVADDHVQERRGRLRITPAGREALDALLAEERAALDADEVSAIHHEFTPFNDALKQIVSDWQVRDGEPNDHADEAYDAAIVARLEALHGSFLPVAERLGVAVGRLAPYPGRLTAALRRVVAGEHRFLINPMVDSYHQVWFELHEDLILAAGLRRLDEAAAGRAQ